jgi:lipopolysaccharide/colanic/teichoic acid biosynthesis glycosyltransferase
MRPPKVLILAGVALLVVLALALTLGADYFATRNGVGEITSAAGRAEARDAARRTLLQAAAGLAVLVAGLFTYWRIRISEHEQITERFTNSIEQLGSDQLAIRLGAIAALERISRDSKVDRPAIAEVLSAFVRESNPRSDQPIIDYADKVPSLSADRQYALTALGRATPINRLDRRASDQLPINLSGSHLAGADISGLNFSGAVLVDCDLSGAKLEGTRLRNTHLSGANLNRAQLNGASLRGADLKGCTMTGASFVETDFTVAVLGGGRIERANMRSAILDRVSVLAGTCFLNCNLAASSVCRGRLEAIQIVDSNLSDAKLRRSNLSHSIIESTDLSRADLRKAQMVGCKLANVRLPGALVDSVDVRGASMDYRSLREAAGRGLTPQRGWRLGVKRVLDFSLSALLLIMLAPVLLLLSMLMKVTDPGPIFFRQVRVGREGQIFTLIKFRTMSVSAEDRLQELMERNERTGPLFKVSSDPRVSPLGMFMRRSALDEVPQLFNVLGGSMSLVGPRPALPAETAEFDDAFATLRQAVYPGLTGTSQLSPHLASFDEYRRLDMEYIGNWSLRLDLRILLRTAAIVLRSAVRALRRPRPSTPRPLG